MVFTVSMSGRRCPVFFGGMGHGQNIFAAERSYYTSSVRTAQLGSTGSTYDDDDKPVEPPPPADAAENGMLLLTMHLEYPAIANDAAHDNFAVMLHVKAPSLLAVAGRAPPVDLVTVLDVSGSMAGAKLEQVKRAMGFVVDSLGLGDRLSVVVFSDDARRVLRLTRMSDDGKAAAKGAMESLVAAGSGSGSANVRAGLDEAAKVLDGSQYNNDVAGVILISDGHDYTASDYSDLVPPFLVPPCGCRRTPVHSFVLGSDNGAAAAMHHISEVTGGTFSFVEDHAVIQEALARCVGGLVSRAANDVWIEVDCSYPSVRAKAFKSGRYKCSLKDWDRDRDWDWDYDWENQKFTVNVGDLYAGEERRFLLLLDIDKADDAGIMDLMDLECSYWDTATSQQVQVEEGHYIPRTIDAGDVAPSMDVKKEILRVEAAEDMALARTAAERGDYAEAARILDARREVLSRSPPALSGDATCKALAAQLHELSLRVSNEREYRRTGRACFLAGVSSHAQQRASSVRLSRPMSPGLDESGCVGSAMFATPAMRKMEKLSEMLRERQRQKEAALVEDASRVVVPRPRLEARLAAAAPRLSMLRKYRRLLLLKR